MKIAIVLHRDFRMIGGLENFVQGLVKAFSHKYSLHFISFTKKQSYTSETDCLREVYIQSKYLFSDVYPTPGLINSQEFYKTFVDLNPDIILTFGRHFISSWIAQYYAIKQHKVLIHTEQANGKHSFTNPLFGLIQFLQDKTIISYLLERASIVLPGSNSVRDFLKTEFTLSNLSEKNAYSFLDFDEMNNVSGELQLTGVRNDKINMLFVGRLVEVKGFRLFLKLAERLTCDSRFNFVMIGGREGSKLVSRFAGTHKENFTYLGELSRRETLKYIKKCDIFFNLSMMEGLPMTILEAMYFNKKIVATDIGPNIEALRNYSNCELSKPNIESILEKIEILVKRKEVIESFPYRFTLESTADTYESIFKTL
jgi:glycosyltransferase involved in cell wall biosynthesis